MARSTLYNFGRANRNGELLTPEFQIPDTPDGGLVRGTLDVLPNQRDDATRVIDYWLEVQIAGVWAPIMQGQWRGNPDTTTMPTEETPVVGGGLDHRGAMARFRVVVNKATNFGGTVEWLDFAEGWERAQKP